ncbi:sigma-70 family RNA polymerase sigma factor [Effusibacillus dendaii]|uniref:RNA polymerase sigma factor n=1 Tax=Effusibacillus dendaii TaxID=2743772 RepID=A0A7I8D9L0_9BACL|nr:sigma-70 family RNA polymerase sigma factor [Effusibacillus dendaii]BCJ86794.1 hypothetical protein skT53_17790 [Effusibacillus dendaii]
MQDWQTEAEKKRQISEWVSLHGAAVIRTAFYYVKDQMVAEDIAQEVFLRAYQKFDAYRGESAAATWLYRITVNACKDYLRSWSYRKLVLMQPFAENVSERSAEQEAMNRMNRNELLCNAMRLPLKYREVIVLHYLEGLKRNSICIIRWIFRTRR